MAESPRQPQFFEIFFDVQDIRLEAQAKEHRDERPIGGRRVGPQEQDEGRAEREWK